MTLQPFESVSVNMRDLKERNILPASAEYGGFRISGRSSIESKLLVKEHIVTETGRTSAPYYGGFPYVVEYCFYYYGCLYSKDLDTDDTAEGIAVYVWNDTSTTSDTRAWYDIWGIVNSHTSLSAGTLGTSSVTVTGASVGSGGVGGTSLSVPADTFGNPSTFPAFLQVQVNQRCFAQLKYRGAFMGANHAFWWIQTSSGTRYVTLTFPPNPFS